jgi:plastocyanin
VFFQPRTTNLTPGTHLEIENNTNPQRVGPHTFSLVRLGVRPDTKRERQRCFNKGHICRKIARWHDIDFASGDVGTQSVDVGLPGWDTMGNIQNQGDSWYTEEKNDKHGRNVSANPGRTLYFMCAVHPNMKGKIVVAP